jgi:hypothetical protein
MLKLFPAAKSEDEDNLAGKQPRTLIQVGVEDRMSEQDRSRLKGANTECQSLLWLDFKVAFLLEDGDDPNAEKNGTSRTCSYSVIIKLTHAI